MLRSMASPLQWREWEEDLVHYPDRQFANYLVEGIREGFRLGYDYSRAKCRRAGKNRFSGGAPQGGM